MRDPIFVDTWGWLALGHRRDQNHSVVKEYFQKLKQEEGLLHTSDYILDEVMTLVFKRESFDEARHFMDGIFQASNIKELQIHRVTPSRFEKTWQLRTRLQDKPNISFTDLSSMVLMDELGLHFILSQDNHFLQVGMGFSFVEFA